MDEGTVVQVTELRIFGTLFPVEIFSRTNGRCFAMTRFSEYDIIITDGASAHDVLEQHATCLPIAVSCRSQRLTRTPFQLLHGVQPHN